MRVDIYRLEYHSDVDNSHKFWEAYAPHGGDFPVHYHWGRVGTAGQVRVNYTDGRYEAADKALKKRREGYREVFGEQIEMEAVFNQDEFYAACRAAVDQALSPPSGLDQLDEVLNQAEEVLAVAKSKKDLAVVLERWGDLSETYAQMELRFQMARSKFEEARAAMEKRLMK